MATLKTQIQLRRDTAANLADIVPVNGEPVYATDTKKFSIGDGSTKFSALKDYGFVPDIPDEGDYARKQEGIFYVEGNSTKNGVWTGTNDRITSYYDGLTVAYKTNTYVGWNSTTLNINNLGAVYIHRCMEGLFLNPWEDNNMGVPKGSVIILVYTTQSNGIGAWEWSDSQDTTNTAGATNTSKKIYLIGSQNQSSGGNVTYSHDSVYVGTDGCVYSNFTKVSVEGHTHTADEISGLVIPNNRDIFCIDLLTDRSINELDLEGGQVNLNDDLLTMVYGTIAPDFEGENEVFGILISVNNGTTQTWFALVNNDTDEVAYQSGFEKIFDETQQDSPLQNLNTLSNYHIEVFTCFDIVEIYDTLADTYYVDIEQARNNLTYLCTIRLSEDKTKWIVQ